MLFETIHMPPIYACLPTELATEDNCAQLITILRQTLASCVLLVDEKEEVRYAIARAVRQWPLRYRKMGMELLTELWNSNRFVTLPEIEESVTPSCGTPACDQCCRIKAGALHFAVVREGCVACQALRSATTVRDFVLSPIYNQLAATSIRVPSLLWDRHRFSDRIWRPIFRYAKYVEIVDAQIGRRITKGLLPTNYTRTLEWMLEEASASSAKGLRSVSIYTGHPYWQPTSGPEVVRIAGRNWASAVCTRLNLQFELNFHSVREEPDAHFPHERYLFTDQIALNIGRGFDLLVNDARDSTVRDVHIHREEFETRGKIMAEIRQLPST